MKKKLFFFFFCHFIDTWTHTHIFLLSVLFRSLLVEKKFFFSKQIHVHIYTTLVITVILKIQLHHITVTHSLFSYTLVYYKGQLLSFLFSLFVVFNNDIASCCRHTLAYFIDTITYKEYL